jgi:hypothetical protein
VIRNVLPAVGALTLAVTSSACSQVPFRHGANSLPEPTLAASALDGSDSRDQAPVMPFAIARDDDYVVRVVAGPVTCSGTLIDEDRVLTAHHCVTERSDYGDILERDVPAERVRVELGGDYLPWGEVGVRAIVAPPCGHKAGRGDIAILVLERKLIGVATLEPQLDRSPAMGESVSPVGFGRCALSGDGIRRRSRLGGTVAMVRDDAFRLRASVCPGDSGGPALSHQTGELVGVISASVMDGNEDTRGLSEFTRLDHWRPVFASAKLIAEGASPAELPPIECSPGR